MTKSAPPADRDTDRRTDRHRGRSLPALLVTAVALGAVQAAAWFYFRRQQPVVDELTRERLQPRSDA